MDEGDRRAALTTFSAKQIDADFLPFLERINRLPHAVSEQCCSGHMEYQPIKGQVDGRCARWGYLQLCLDLDLADWLSDRILDCGWLLLERSQLWDERAGRVPGITEAGSYQLTFAWDAGEWPKPIDEICGFIEEYHENCVRKNG
jgi:hypothetical protein